MMKAILSLVAILATITTVLSQPVITRDHLMVAGDVYNIADVASVPSAGLSGAQVVWDFSGVVNSAPAAQDVVLPGGTPYGGSFPASNLVFVAKGGSIYQYQNLTNSGLQELGYVVPGFSSLTYDNPRQYLQFPLTYQDQWNDGYTYTLNYQTTPPITSFGEGVISVEVDGYGTLILPQGTFNNVLRIRILGASTDTTDLGFNLYERNYYQDTTHVWLSTEYFAPLATHITGSLLRYTTVAIGDTSVTEETDAFQSFSIDPLAEAMPSATNELSRNRIGVEVSPNPALAETTLSFTAAQSGTMQFALRTITGAQVFAAELAVVAGDNVIPVSLPRLAQGIYLGILSSDEEQGVVKITIGE